MSLATLAFDAVIERRLRLAAERLVRYPFRPWFYGDSIGFEGLVAASRLLDDARYAGFASDFLRDWALSGGPPGPDDNTAPGRVLCGLAEGTSDAALETAALGLAHDLTARRRVHGTAVTFEDARRSLREPYGELALSEADRELLRDPGAGVYVDCLHFDPPFYASLQRLTREEAWGERAVEEALGYCRLLQDRPSGLFHHFWLERSGRAYGLGWGRGQGWALLGLLDVLEGRPPGSPGRGDLEAATLALLEAMLRTQRRDGSWDAVAGAAESGDETSTAAFMAVAFLRAARLDIGDVRGLRRAALRGWRATLVALDDTGLLSGVSAAVYSSTMDEHYHHVPLGFDVPWGQGPLLVAATEVATAAANVGVD